VGLARRKLLTSFGPKGSRYIAVATISRHVEKV
jgi:hypothetical protein